MALGTHTKFHLQILTAIHKFQENILESSQNISETPQVTIGSGNDSLWSDTISMNITLKQLGIFSSNLNYIF